MGSWLNLTSVDTKVSFCAVGREPLVTRPQDRDGIRLEVDDEAILDLRLRGLMPHHRSAGPGSRLAALADTGRGSAPRAAARAGSDHAGDVCVTQRDRAGCPAEVPLKLGGDLLSSPPTPAGMGDSSAS